MNTNNEMVGYLKSVVFPDLLKGRGEFDINHTKVALKYLQKYKKYADIKTDWLVLIIAVIAHDWGYLDQFEKGEGSNMKLISKKKDVHMALGAKKLKRLLSDKIFNSLTSKQKERAVQLVAIHDKLNQLKKTDELILMELDTLGGLVCSEIPRYFEIVRDVRLPLFLTDYGKNECNRLLKRKMITHL